MHVVVVGCGRVGRELAVNLERDGNTVAIIDREKRAFRRLPERWTGRAVLGQGFDRDTLEQAGIRQASALASVTNGDNTNIVTARIAREHYDVANVVARIYDPRRAAVYQKLGIPTVATVSWTTDQVLRRLVPERRPVEWTDASGDVRLVEAPLPEAWVGRPLSDVQAPGWRLVALQRGGTGRLVADDLLGEAGDVLHIAVQKDADDRLEQLLTSGGEPA